MAVQVVSDLHLESPKAYDVFELEPKAPYLALLGDIGNVAAHKDDCLAFLTRQLRQFRAVLFVPGNHEAYHSTWPATLEILAAFEREAGDDPSLGTFVLLDRATFRLPDCCSSSSSSSGAMVIAGCSLFSAVPDDRQMAVSMGLNDFYMTGSDWDVAAHNAAHRRDLSWLNARVAELEQQPDVGAIVILSHWSPSMDARAADPRHAASPITSGFATDLSTEPCFKSSKVKVWAFGHTHYNCDFLVERGLGPLRLVTNQRGYYFDQARGFDGQKTIEL
ncbi:Metallo-dependent phosphatase-like protein [Lasiosphaeria ovina]|uniref:Metallo-dependent phosphatase-like protein n=1 Tax=Lasiosphaeria ovina TaxID=92902 RepID=A0AAE0K949_9PEZI|nr:Metallo-dependent phosphatase-like protein [Lasiosphaeria ovina]